MRKYEKKTIKSEYDVLCEVKCDICGATSESCNWEKSIYKHHETDVSVSISDKSGENYPSGGFGRDISFDICPKCFFELLVPFLESYGAKPYEKEWDY